MTDPIADLLTRIRNAMRARQLSVDVPASKMKEAIVSILKKEGYVGQVIREENGPQATLKIFLKYELGGKKPLIRRIARVSRPGGRRYSGYSQLRPYLNGMGIRILSTPKGLLTDGEARKQKVGGEILCEVW